MGDVIDMGRGKRRQARRPSKIDQLPKELRDQIEDLRAGGHTIDQIKAHLDEMILDDEERVSRSSVGRHVIEIDDMLEDVRKSRHEVAEVARTLREHDGIEVSEVNRQILETEYFRLLKGMRGLEAGPDADMLKSLAAGMRANTAGRKDEAAMRRELKAEVEREMRAKLDKAAKTKGFTKGTVDLIFETVLGADG